MTEGNCRGHFFGTNRRQMAGVINRWCWWWWWWRWRRRRRRWWWWWWHQCTMFQTSIDDTLRQYLRCWFLESYTSWTSFTYDHIFIHSFRLFLKRLFKSAITQRRSRHRKDTVSEFYAETPQATASERLAQGPYVAARAGFEPTTLRTKCRESTNKLPRPHEHHTPHAEVPSISALVIFANLLLFQYVLVFPKAIKGHNAENLKAQLSLLCAKRCQNRALQFISIQHWSYAK